MTHIVSRPSKMNNEGFEFEIDFNGDEFDDRVGTLRQCLGRLQRAISYPVA